jgi:glycosyltransferase involved in cell wall biosynthesis
MPVYPGRLGVQQRVLPDYRAAFFDALAEVCAGGLGVFAGQPLAVENIASGRPQIARLFPAENIHTLDPSSRFYRCRQPGILDWLADWQPDALVIEANPRYPDNFRAIEWMHAHKRPVIGWGLGAPPVGGLLGWWRKRERLNLLKRLDGVVAYSRKGADEYRALGLPSERVFTAPNAAARRPVAPPPARPERLDGPAMVLFVGRLQARKRVDLLIRACAALPEVLRPRLMIVGDGPARAEFEAAAGGYPLAEFTGARRGPELDALFDQADLFVLPGTGGLAVQQAMAHGLPVMVAEGDGTQDDLLPLEAGVQASGPQRAVNGWRLPPGDPAALQAVLQQALADIPSLRRMGAESYRIVREEVNLEAMAGVFVGALMQVARGFG